MAEQDTKKRIDESLRLRRAEMLLNVSTTVAAYEKLDDVLMTLVELISAEIGAERSTLFLNDERTGELYSRVAEGDLLREIRILNTAGVAGHVYQTGEGTIVDDAYENEFFESSVDEQTGYVTKTILSAPIKTVKGEIIGVAQVLNKKDGKFTKQDLDTLQAMTTQAAIAMKSTALVERMQKKQQQEMEFLDIVSDVTAEIDLGTLLQKVMGEATRMLNADRSTLFLNDERSKELYTFVGEGLGATEIRFPNHLGIAGSVFTSGETINIPHAYADLRFNPSFDKQTGFFTRSILCVPVINKTGKTIGVTQVLNKRGGPFTSDDESRLRAFTAQISIALENAKLFDDVQNMKNYNESILESMSNGVITLDEDNTIVTCNAAGANILRVKADDILNKSAQEFFHEQNQWLLDKLHHVVEAQQTDHLMDAALKVGSETISANVTLLPLISIDQKKLGSMIMIEDISSEKRMKSTMSRYMDASIADQLMQDGEEILGGKSVEATLLFSDIRGFTPITEELGPTGTVALLNEYFTIMVDCIQNEGGMLDKFVGDAIMAVFGLPIAGEDDADRAVRAAISMHRELDTWNHIRHRDGKMPVQMGIGLNTDTVVSGNIGSPKRMDFTVIGDGVNLAARLESASKQYAARLLISEFTVAKLKGTYRMREIDKVVVKGKSKPVSIFEVLEYHTDKSFPNLMDVVGYFKEGLHHYRKANWTKAIGNFEEALKLHPKDRLSEIYIDRCQHLIEQPPADDWDGVWVMKEK